MSKTINFLDYLINRHKEEDKAFLQVFEGDDTKQSKNVSFEWFDLHKTNTKTIKDYISKHNKKPYGIFLNLHPMINKERKKESASKIKFLFIDVDDNPSKDEMTKITKYFETIGLNYCYMCKSGGGYHIVFPLDLDVKHEQEYKDYGNYLHNNISKHIDTKVFDLARLIRIPESLHYKKEEYKLKTLVTDNVNKGDIQINDKIMLKEFKKCVKPIKKQSTQENNNSNSYQNEFFFTTILNSNLPEKYIQELNNLSNRNDNFVKNLGIFVYLNSNYEDKAIEFLNQWESMRVGALKGWIKQAEQQEMTVNHKELFSWLYNALTNEERKTNELYKLIRKHLNKNKNITYSKEEYNTALDILQNKDPLEYCLNTLTKRHIGEKNILLLLLISAITPGMKDRKFLIHCMGVGASGKGKTNSMEVTGKIFNNFETVISASPKNIFYKAGDNKLITNGVLFFPESDINSEEFTALERVITDDLSTIPKHETVIQQKAKALEIKQINVMWRNSVGTSTDDDNQLNNRYYIFNVDETKEQDELVFDHILDNWNNTTKEDDTDLNVCKAITDLIKQEPKKVLIPYIKFIDLDNKQDRRTIKKFLKLVVAVTYFYRHQRILGDENYILSEIKDFDIALHIWNSINKNESSKMTNKEIEIINEISTLNTGYEFNELVKILKKDKGYLSKQIKEMEEKGLIYSERHTEIETDQYNKKIVKPKKYLYASRCCHSNIRLKSLLTQKNSTSNLEIQSLGIQNIRYKGVQTTVVDLFSESKRETLKKIDEKIKQKYNLSFL